MAPLSTSRATLAVVLAAVLLILLLLFVDAATSHGGGGAHAAPVVVDDPAAAAGRWWVEEHGDVVRGGAVACRAGEWCADGGGSGVGEASGSRRRELGGGNFIGYDALRRNTVPCSYRGASYYNCRPGRPANPYSRGCSAITQCRG